MRPRSSDGSARPSGLFVAALAFLVDRALEKKVNSAGLDLSSREAWQILRTVRVVEIDLGGGKSASVTRGSGRAAQILKAPTSQLDPGPAKKQAPEGA